MKDSLTGPDHEKWIQALIEEYQALWEHKTVELWRLPDGLRSVLGNWVLRIKRGNKGEIERYKARYVARGFAQEERVDFFETWAPVGSYTKLRALCSISVVEDLEMKHIGIECAFLNGMLEESVCGSA